MKIAHADPRHQWARDYLAAEAHEHILEIGCGYGITASLIAEDLDTGSLTCIDKSAAMIGKAERNNGSSILSARTRFITGTLFTASLPTGFFDKIFAFNVGLFLKDPRKELQVISTLLNKRGQLYIFYQPPFESASLIEKQILSALERGNYAVSASVIRPAQPASIVSVTAAPNR